MPVSHPFFGTPTVGAGVAEQSPSGTPKGLPTEAAMMRFAIEVSKRLGEPFPIVGPLKTPAGWDENNPFDYFPAFRVDQDHILAEANWPYLVPFYRESKVEHGNVSTFAVTGWAISSNVVTLTFADSTTEKQVLAALEEDKNYRGGYRTVTVPALGAAVPANTYQITGINPTARTLTFAYTTGNTSGGGVSVEFHLHRIPGSSSTAKWYKSNGAAFMTPGDSNGYFVMGLSRRGYIQKITGYADFTYGAVRDIDGAFNGVLGGGSGSYPGSYSGSLTEGRLNFDSSAVARSADDTNGPAMAAWHYIWGRRYIP